MERNYHQCLPTIAKNVHGSEGDLPVCMSFANWISEPGKSCVGAGEGGED